MGKRVWHGIVAAVFATLVGPGYGQDPTTKPKPAEVTRAGQTDGERVAGVVYKIEAGDAKDAKSATKRLRINTSIPWEDYVRDQAQSVAASKGAASKDTSKGDRKDSVAVLGHPRENDVVIVVEAPGDSVVERRFRSARDDATKGAATPEGALKVEERAVDPARDARPRGESTEKGDLSSLKEGQFVEVTYKKGDDRKQASRVFIFLPVDRDATPARDGNTRAPGKAESKP